MMPESTSTASQPPHTMYVSKGKYVLYFIFRKGLVEIVHPAWAAAWYLIVANPFTAHSSTTTLISKYSSETYCGLPVFFFAEG